MTLAPWPHPFPRIPTEHELPYEDGIPVESTAHASQRELLSEPLRHHFATRDNLFIATDLGVYFSDLQVVKNEFRAPDFMVFVDVVVRPRKSWVVYYEDGRYPNVVVELLSDSTRAEDLGPKKRIYEKVWRVPEYFAFDVDTGELLGWRLTDSHDYEPVLADADGRLSCRQLGLALGTQELLWQQDRRRWLRWWSPDGTPLATGDERARVEAERARVEAERADALAAKLRAYEARFGALEE